MLYVRFDEARKAYYAVDIIAGKAMKSSLKRILSLANLSSGVAAKATHSIKEETHIMGSSSSRT
jgi:hypothetical protein